MINWLNNHESNVLLMHSDQCKDLDMLVASLLISMQFINDFNSPNDVLYFVSELFGYKVGRVMNSSYLRYFNHAEEVIKGLIPIDKTVKL